MSLSHQIWIQECSFPLCHIAHVLWNAMEASKEWLNKDAEIKKKGKPKKPPKPNTKIGTKKIPPKTSPTPDSREHQPLKTCRKIVRSVVYFQSRLVSCTGRGLESAAGKEPGTHRYSRAVCSPGPCGNGSLGALPEGYPPSCRSLQGEHSRVQYSAECGTAGSLALSWVVVEPRSEHACSERFLVPCLQPARLVSVLCLLIFSCWLWGGVGVFRELG